MSGREKLKGPLSLKAAMKRATASMMVFWACSTRHALREALLKGDLEAWNDTGLRKLLGDAKLREIGGLIRDLSGALESVNQVADRLWIPGSPECPPDILIKTMGAAMTAAINQNWATERKKGAPRKKAKPAKKKR